MDIRIVNTGQNQGAITAATVENLEKRNAVAVILLNASGDIYNAGPGQGQDGAIVDGVNSAVRATVLNDSTALPSSSDKALVVQFANGTTREVGKVTVRELTAPVGITGDVSTTPKAGQTWPVSFPGGVTTNPPVTGAQVVGGSIGGRFSISGDIINTREQNVIGVQVVGGSGGGTVGVSGDVSTKPLAGQTWPVSVAGTVNTSEQQKIGVHVAGGTVGISGDVNVTVQIGDVITVGAVTAPVGISGDVSTKPLAGQTWPVSFPSGLTIGAITAPVGISGDVSTKPLAGQTWPVSFPSGLTIGVITAPVGITGDVSTTPKAGQTWPTSIAGTVNTNQQGVIGVQVVGGSGGGTVGVSGDVSTTPKVGSTWPVSFPSGLTIGAITAPVGITGDVSTTPKAGQTWPVSIASTVNTNQQGVIGVQVVGGSGGGTVGVSGDVSTKPLAGQTWPVSISAPVTIGIITVPAGISGDVSTTPKAGQTWPVSISGLVGITGDVSVRQDSTNTPKGTLSTPIGVNVIGGSVGGRVSISGDILNTSQQGVIGVQVLGGQVGGAQGVSGDVAIKPSTNTPAGSYHPVSGDVGISDGVTRATKATVRAYANSNPVAVALTNVSGDVYSPTPKEPICQTIPFNITSNGTTVIAGPYTGRVIKVTAYDLQGSSNIATAQGHFGSGASGSQLTHDWLFAIREGVSKAISPLGGGYFFKTLINQSLVFELSAGSVRGSVTFHSGDSL